MKKLSALFSVILLCGFIISCETGTTTGSSNPYSVMENDDSSAVDGLDSNSTEKQNTDTAASLTDAGSNSSNSSTPIKMTAAEQKEFFKTYVAIGDSLTQGCQGLNVEENRQYYSWPAQLARLMNTEFNQGLIAFPGVGMPNPEDAFRQGWFDTQAATVAKFIKSMMYWHRTDKYDNQANLNNFGIAGATIDQMLSFDPAKIVDFNSSPIPDLVGMFNPFVYAATGLSPLNVKCAVDQALDRNPTFTTVWAGNNDTMYATVIGDPALCTPLAYFKASWDKLVAKIKASKSLKGVLVVNLPDNTSMPFLQPINNKFHTVSEGGNIPAGSKVPFFVTRSKYISEVLTPDEMTVIQNRIVEFNKIIAATCLKENWAMVDCYTIFKYQIPAKGGMTLLRADGSESKIFLTDAYGTGGIFSLDGMHPTSAGYSRFANVIAQTINKHYGTSLPIADEVAVWEKDTLCQDPFDPRETNPTAMGNLSYITNTMFLMMSKMM